VEGTTQTADTTSNKDAAVMSGGPAGDHGKPMPKQGEPHPDFQTKGTETKEAVKFELNGKTFESAQEMSKYVADLERKVVNNPPPQQFTQPQVVNQKELIEGRPIDEVMFTDPDKYTKYLENKVEQKLQAQRTQEENIKRFWSQFYIDNPDLKGKEEIIDALAKANFDTWSKLPPDQIAGAVAKESRTKLKRAGLLANSQEVSNNPAGTLSSSGQSAPTVQQERKVLTFVEEMQARKRARKKA
jgi:hypothetical protein